MNRQPKIAILRWEEGLVPEGLMQLEALPGNSTNRNSYPFPVRLVHVPGACVETVITHPSEKLLEDMKLPFGAENLNKALLHLKLQHKDDLYVSLAKGHLDIEEVRKALKKKSENKFVKYWKLQFFKSDKDKSVQDKDEKKGEVINDITADDASDFIIAPCCNPIPGDDVVGMKIDGDKITVHKRKCPEAIRLMSSYGDKIVPVKWVSHKIMSFLAVIKLNGIDSTRIVSDITMIISKESNVNMRTVHFETKDGIFEGMIHLYVHNTADLNNLMMKIASLKGVENVSRVENLDI